MLNKERNNNTGKQANKYLSKVVSIVDLLYFGGLPRKKKRRKIGVNFISNFQKQEKEFLFLFLSYKEFRTSFVSSPV